MGSCNDHRIVAERLNAISESLATNPHANGGAEGVCASLRQWIACKHICAPNLLKAIDIAEVAIGVYFGHRDSDTIALKKACLGMHAAECVARRMLEEPYTVTDHWEQIVWAFVELLWKRGVDNVSAIMPPSFTLKQWAISMFRYPHLCPNHHLRLQMLPFIAEGRTKDMCDHFNGKLITSGVVLNSVHLSIQLDLLPEDGQKRLFTALVRVLHGIRRCQCFSVVISHAIELVRGLQVGPEVQCLAHLIQLVDRMALRAKENCDSGIVSVPKTLDALKSTLTLLQLLTKDPLSLAYESPGLAQMAASALVNVTSSVVSVLPAVQNHEQASRGYWIVVALDDIFRTLADPPSAVLAALRRDHSHTLSQLRERATGLRHPLFHLPEVEEQEEGAESCPEQFLDSVTQAVMEDPVLLKWSQMEVDESTLMKLLLESPKDPFTRHPLDQDSYSRLPDRKNQIQAWRESSSTSQKNTHERP